MNLSGCIALLLSVVCVEAGAQARIAEGGSGTREVVAITAAKANQIYIADEKKGLSFREAESVPTTPRKIRAGGQRIRGLTPRGLAYRDPYLYVYDAESRQVIRFDPDVAQSPREPIKGVFENPSHFAVSPQGVVAVLNGGELSFHQSGVAATRYEGRRFSNVAGLAFATWTSLLVVSGDDVITIDLTRQKDGSVRFVGESVERVRAPAGEKWEAMDVREGVLFLATKRQIYARLDNELIPILAQAVVFDDLDDFAIVKDGVYVLDDDELWLVARAVPVDIILEGSAAAAQAALLDIYGYLANNDFLPLRKTPSEYSVRSVPSVWFEQGAVITAKDLKFEVPEKHEPVTANPRTTQVWRAFCHLQRRLGLVTGSCTTPHESVGAAFHEVPNFYVERNLSQQRVTLESALGTYLDENLPSTQLRARADPASLRALNPELKGRTDAEVMSLSSGSVVVPSEMWSITVGVPAQDYYNRQSLLWTIASRYPSMLILSRRAFEDQSAKAVLLQDDDDPSGGGAAPPCDQLKDQRKRLWDRLGYPILVLPSGPIGHPTRVGRQVRIGLLENGNTVLTGHYVFTQSTQPPVWFELTDSGLEAIASPQSTTPISQLGVDAVPFSVDLHHGTHVAALLAGQSGPCWSGLLPRARLVLIDLKLDRAVLYRKVKEALNQNVRVFNVSQTWLGGQDNLFKTVKAEPLALWVVAAGNDGLHLDGNMDVGSVPAMARWNGRSNVVSVTASDKFGDQLVAALDDAASNSANRGKLHVDLVAPGHEILSATEQGGFARASGTSQAAPMVAAAAALLVDPLGAGMTPGDAKARLIATAQWSSAYKDLVWGGWLDFGMAVSHVDLNVLSTATDRAQSLVHVIDPSNDPKIVFAAPATYYDREDDGASAPDEIDFSQILSLRRLSNGLHRLVFKGDDGKLRIVLDAALQDAGNERLECVTYERLDVVSGARSDDAAQCQGGLSVASIDTYFKRKGYDIQWGGSQ